MPVPNSFYGVSLYASTVAEYYQNNMQFDHFVFQPDLTLSIGESLNSFSLTVYALDAYGNTISDGPIHTDPFYPSPFKATGEVIQFANYRLYRSDLWDLYKQDVNSDLIVYAQGFYPLAEGYVQYYAVTAGSIVVDSNGNIVSGNNTVAVNPSPPAPPRGGQAS